MVLAENPIYNRSLNFAKEIIIVVKTIRQDPITKPLVSQLVRAVTSIGANISEATFGASRKDFINKIAIALKEACETQYWLDILMSSGYLAGEKMSHLQAEIVSIIKILSAIRQNTAEKAVT